MIQDPYKVLGVNSNASIADIKAAYRELVKKHHPDAGGDAAKILTINAAWEILGDRRKKKEYDFQKNRDASLANEIQQRGVRNAHASAAAKAAKIQIAIEENDLLTWLKEVYNPIDRLLGEVINPFPKKLKALSADPYDDVLMEDFCEYLEACEKRLGKVHNLYQSTPIPSSAKGFGLTLYHCLSQVEDAVSELKRYTMGYVDSYLHDGREMLIKAKLRRLRLKEERRRFKNS